jgi:hypothetical protein
MRWSTIARWGATLGAVSLVVLFFAWTATSTVQAWQWNPHAGYYNHLVDGFLQGQLHMAVEPHPDLLSDDADTRAAAPFLLDASLYDGKYHLYFGVTPAVLLFLPWKVLTGSHLPENLATVILATCGYLLAIGILVHVTRRARWRPSLGGWIALVVAVGLAAGVPLALRRSLFYEVAAVSAFACGMLFLYGALRSLTGHSRASVLSWLALTSWAYALAVGSRANLAPVGVLLPVLAFISWRRISSPQVKALTWHCVAGGVPAALGLAGLFLYNYARFGALTEFGHSHQLGSNPEGFPFALRFLWHNLQVYYASWPSVSPYFPFVAPGLEPARPSGYWGIEHVHGQWFALLLLPIGYLGWREALRAEPARHRALAPWIGLSTAWFIVAGCLVWSIGVRANRYLLDYHAALVVAAAVAILLLWASPRSALRWLSRAGLAVLLLGGFYNVLGSIQLHSYFQDANLGSYARLEKNANALVWTLLGRPSQAPAQIDLVVTFPTTPAEAVEPLIVTGTPWFSDTLMVEYPSSGYIQFRFDHLGQGGPASGALPVRAGETHHVRVEMGSFLPPINHPFFARTDLATRRFLKRRLSVALDGHPVLAATSDFYDSAPHHIRVGDNPLWPTLVGRRFSGEIHRVNQTNMSRTELTANAPISPGPLHLRVRFPSDRIGQTEPLLLSGTTGQGDVLTVHYPDERHIVFGHDHWGVSYQRSPLIPIQSDRTYDLEVHWGAMYPTEDTRYDALRRLLLVRLDGVIVWQELTAFHAASSQSLDLGANDIGASTAMRRFHGHLEQYVRMPAPTAIDWSERAEPSLLSRYAQTHWSSGLHLWENDRMLASFPTGTESPGAATLWELRSEPTSDEPTMFAPGVPVWLDQGARLELEVELGQGPSEPLVATGRTGRADVLIVERTGPDQIAFVHDHWGSGASRSAVQTIDPTQLQHVVVQWQPVQRRLQVALNGAEVWRTETEWHPADGQVEALAASQGFSTTAPVFTGKLHRIRLTPPDRSLP